MSELTTVNAIEKFRAAMTAGIESIAEAANIYTKTIDNDPASKKLFHSKCPDIPKWAWIRFERIGRGQLDKRLLFGGGKAQGYLQRLPISDQRNALSNGVEVLTHRNDCLIVKVEDLTVEQREQVFSQDSIRDIPAQKAFVEGGSKKKKKETVDNIPDFEVVGKRLNVYRPCVITKRKLTAILKEIM